MVTYNIICVDVNKEHCVIAHHTATSLICLRSDVFADLLAVHN